MQGTALRGGGILTQKSYETNFNMSEDIKLSPWISVEDHLPSPNTGCIVYSVYSDCVDLAVFKKTRTGFNFVNAYKDRSVIKNITHWMPTPEKP